jgi:hypothetical protein
LHSAYPSARVAAFKPYVASDQASLPATPLLEGKLLALIE